MAKVESHLGGTGDRGSVASVERSLALSLRSRIDRYWQSFSFMGLIWATILFAISLTPSLLPRIYAVQGLLSGIALAVGYGIGVALAWLWIYLELPQPRGHLEKTSA